MAAARPEAWCGDRIAILGYEGRRDDLAPPVVAETGLDGTAYYDDTLASAAQLAQDVLLERGVRALPRRAAAG